MNFSKREWALWLLFLVLCLTAGYLKGIMPADAWPTLWGGPAEAEILVHQEKFLPSTLVEELQKKLGIRIKVTVVHDREEFTIRTITSPGYHLALIPDHWIEPATIANLMSNLNPLADLANERISPDFNSNPQSKLFGVPLYWMSTRLWRNSMDPPKAAYFLNDWDYIAQKIATLHLQNSLVVPLEFGERPPTGKEANKISALFEISHLRPPSAQEGLKPAVPDLMTLYIWSLCTPRHSPSRKITLQLARALMDSDLQLKILPQLELATTLKTLDDAVIPRSQKSLMIREMNLSELKKPQWLSVDQIKEMKIEFSSHKNRRE
jgi:hypothetical protein